VCVVVAQECNPRSQESDTPSRPSGRYDLTTKKIKAVLQINSRAESPGLRDWARKKSTHVKLATEAIDTSAQDYTAELGRVLVPLESQAKNKLGFMGNRFVHSTD
jgi:hypothetical protein